MDAIKSNFETIVQQARKDGAKVEMLISGGENLRLKFSKKKLDSFESTQSQVAGLRVIVGGSQGYAYTENLNGDSLLRTYNEALNNAKSIPASNAQDIPMVKPQTVKAMNDLYQPEEIAMDKKLEVARLLEEQCLEKDPRIQSVPYSGFNDSLAFKRILNSEGLDQEFKQTYFSGWVYPLAKQGETNKMDGEGFFVRRFKDINVADVVSKGVQKAVERLDAKKLKTGNYAVVIDRTEFATVMQMFADYLSAQEVYEGKSLFADKLGQKIASEAFQLLDDPFETSGTGVRPFDDEGAPSQKTLLIENGVLRNYLTNLEYSQKMNLPHTGHAARSPASKMGISATNLVVGKGTQSLQDLLSSYDTVVHVTKFAGGLHAGFKESTGDISMPAEGFLYEHGKNMGAVDQFVMSGNVLELLKNIVAVGNEYRKPGSSMICPDVLVSSMSFAGA